MPRTPRKPRRPATLTQGSAYSGRHRITLRRWVSEQKIHGWRQGKLIIIDLAELDEFTKPIGG